MKKVAIYARVSTLEQAEHGYSIGEQVDKLKKHCEIYDYSIYKEYVDAGQSGAKLDRPAMQELISDAKNGKFEAVIVYKLDRLSRNLQNALYLIKDVFKANDISFASLSENIDLSTAAGELNFNMFASFAEFERANIRDRMSMGAYARAKSGKSAGPSRTPFGYDYDNGILRKNSITSPIVRSIFDMYLSGMSLSKILLKLNNDGYVGKTKPWRLSTMHNLIRKKTYAGFIKYHDEYFKGLHEPIISIEEFEEVQRQIKIRQDNAYKSSNSTRPFQSKYMLSGLLFCGKCGNRLSVIQYGKQEGIGKPNYKYKYYQCVAKQSYYKKINASSFKDEKCDTPNYNFEELESSIIDEIQKVKFYFDDFINEKEQKYTKGSNENVILHDEISNFEKKLSKLVDLYLDEKIDLDIYEKRKSEYDYKLSTLRENLNSSKKEDKLLTKKEVQKIFNNIDLTKIDYEKRKEIVKKIVRKIVITPDKKTFYWNF